MEDEFRVEVELDDEEHGFSLGERLRALDLDDDARERLGGRAIVTRSGSRLFVYTASEAAAREAERVVRELLAADRLSAQVAVTRWHPVEEAWRDAGEPLPATEEELRAEYERRVAAEAREAAVEGAVDWHVVARLDGRDEAAALARRLAAEGVPVSRRWRYVVADALTRERAEQLVEEIRAEAPAGSEVWVEVDSSDLPLPPFLSLPA